MIEVYWIIIITITSTAQNNHVRQHANDPLQTGIFRQLVIRDWWQSFLLIPSQKNYQND